MARSDCDPNTMSLLLLLLVSCSAATGGDPVRDSNSRQGRFLSAHLDLLDAASSLFPSLRSSYNTQQTEDDLLPAGSILSMSKADKLVASEDDLAQSETIRDMTDSLQDIQTFGAKVNPQLEMAISDHIDTLDASGGEPSSPLLKEVFSSTKTQGRLGSPEGTPQPLLIICEDPAYCPPPVPAYHHPYRRPHHRPGLNICRDPNNCPGGYRPPGQRPYRIKKPGKPTGSPPTYQPPETERPPFKKYGYNPKKPGNPTIWRQQLTKMRKPSKTEEEIRLGARPASTDEEVDHIRNMQKEFVSKYLKKMEEMTMTELKEVIKAAAMEEVKEEKLQKLSVTSEEMTTVAPVIEDAIDKMTMSELKEFVMDVVVDHEVGVEVPLVLENDVSVMTRSELKEVVKETVAMNDAEEEVVAPIIEETIERLTSNELAEVVMEIVEKEKSEDIVVPLVQDAINHMSMTNLKEFIAETVMKDNDEAEQIIEPLVEEAVKEMSKSELKQFVMEKIVEKPEEESLITISPESNIELSMEDLKHLMENEEEEEEEEEIVEEDNTDVAEPTTMDEINKMTMQELRDFIAKNTVKPRTEKPVQKDKMEIKDGMLFKNGQTMKEIKADKMGMTVKEFIGQEEGLDNREINQIKEGVSVEEMIAMKNDVSVAEMIAMKNDLTVEEVMTIKDVLPAAAIVQTRPEIPIEEAIALKANMTIEELVAMKNDIPVEEVIELKDELEMKDIMMLQDGITKEDVVAIIDEEMSVDEVIEMKEEIRDVVKLGGAPAESEKFPNFAKEAPEVINIEDSEGGVSFSEVLSNEDLVKTEEDVNREILESVRNTRPTENRFKPDNKKERKRLKMKMRPLRVKVRKPVVSEETPDYDTEAIDESFGLKNVNTIDKLVLAPTPAVPGLPVVQDPNLLKVKNQFEEFLPSTSSPQPQIPIDNFKTVDFQSEEVSDDDYPIYDYSDSNPAFPVSEPVEKEPALTQSQFIPPSEMDDIAKMPIFNNFPMMKPHEFINLITESEDGELPSFKENQFLNPDRPESIGIEVYEEEETPDIRIKDDLDTFVDAFREEQAIPEEIRPVRMPERERLPPVVAEGSPVHPNHRYPVRTRQPFTAPPRGSVVEHSYMKHRYQHSTGKDKFEYEFEEPYRPYGQSDTSNTALFREISDEREDTRYKRKPYQDSDPYQQKVKSDSEAKVKPFTHFGSAESGSAAETEDYSDPSLVGLNFYSQYGQHDDRPLRLPTTSAPVKDSARDSARDSAKDPRRPGEIRFGGMSFALPPPGDFPDIPEEETEEDFDYYNYDSRPISDVYPDHPLSQVYPDRPVSDIFRDLPQQKQDPSFPTAFPASSDGDESFDKFFTENQYIDNPFGKDFIKLEVDLERFATNKTKPGVHHIPLDVHGFPDVPSYSMETDSDYKIFSKLNKKRNKKKKKPLYRPPPVLTEYKPVFSSRQSEEAQPQYRHQYPDDSTTDYKVEKASQTAPLSGLSGLMEKLMGEHSQWLKLAWQGRDEAAAAAA